MDIEQLRTRREERRRVIRRRRRMALAGLAAAAALVAAIVVVALGAGGGAPRARSAALATSTHATAAKHASAAASASTTAPAGARTGPPGTDPVPILMYHVIAAPPTGAPFPGLYVEPAEFAEQMQALRHDGWHAVTLDQVDAYWRRGVSLGPGKPIVISFDNGYNSQYTQALPVLRKMGWVGDENLQLTGLPPSQGGSDRARSAGCWRRDGSSTRRASATPT